MGLKDPADPLAHYKAKRRFDATPEPAGEVAASGLVLQFVVQKHWATRLHYDVRLEIGGTMKSWAVPKGPSFDSADKRMAVEVEDHPMAYNRFEGRIPAGQYGAGKVIVWDKGTWTPVGDPAQGHRDGKLKFVLHGHKLQGAWTLVRMRGRGSEKKPVWLLIKERDGLERAAADFDVVEEMPDSVGAFDRPPALAPASPAIPLEPVRAALPDTLSPPLATLVDAPPTDPQNWLFELKFDGYRLLARIEHGKVRLFTRQGNDWTAKLPALAAAVGRLPLKSGWLDGEILVLDANGAPDFQALQNAFSGAATQQVVYFVFDLPFADGEDLRACPLEARRARLAPLLPSHGPVRFSAAFEAAPQDLVDSACRIGFEGVIGKRRDAAYAASRTRDWVKLKCGHRQEFVIAGYTDPKGSRHGLGALLLGVHDTEAGGALRYTGNVGSGFSDATLEGLVRELTSRATSHNPFTPPLKKARGVHWVEPTLLAEVSFAGWTQEERVRHAVFRGLRLDKPARAVVREQAQPVAAVSPAAAVPKGVRVSHPQRVIDPSTGITKLDLVRFYATVAELMMPHAHGRPLAVLRAPDGVQPGAAMFFQKHGEVDQMPGIELLDVALDPGHAALRTVARPEGIVTAAQMNVVEFHAWNARFEHIEQPDRVVFDIDPGEGVAWPQVQEAALLVRTLLTELGLPTFLKTSGGKGLHVVVPIQREHGWDPVKSFTKAVVQHLARTVGQRFVAKSGPRNRLGKIFVDYLRNGRGATTVCGWSARARPGMGVSVPVAWSELAGLTSGAHWTVRSIDERLRVGNEPWRGYDQAAVSIAGAMRMLD
jgi:bifunctional non-homologous end joining protein LigD